MKKSTKITLVISGLAVLIVIVSPFLYIFFVVIYSGHLAEKQMEFGKKYMDSLTGSDIQAWIQRTQNYLEEYDTNTWIRWIGSKRPVPPELKKLKIIRIDEQSNEVDYVWMGGFDHTVLEVHRLSDGNFQFTAMYDDYSNRVIWPKTTNPVP